MSETITPTEAPVRVRIKNTLLFNNRVGTLLPNSGERGDIWDYNVDLDATYPFEERTRIDAQIYERRIIGVNENQIERIAA